MSVQAQGPQAQHRVGDGVGLGQHYRRVCACEDRGSVPSGRGSWDMSIIMDLRDEWVLALWGWRSLGCRGL
eukprot:13644179-Alexandrium_andersonii.AAC.1